MRDSPPAVIFFAMNKPSGLNSEDSLARNIKKLPMNQKPNSMKSQPINLSQKFELFSDYWSPKVIGQLNDYHLKLAKIKGEFVWHKHDDTDEMFFVVSGEMSIELRDGSVELSSGDLFVVPKGVEHRPSASAECKILLIEPAGTLNTGDSGGELTVGNEEWV